MSNEKIINNIMKAFYRLLKLMKHAITRSKESLSDKQETGHDIKDTGGTTKILNIVHIKLLNGTECWYDETGSSVLIRTPSAIKTQYTYDKITNLICAEDSYGCKKLYDETGKLVMHA